MIGGLLWGLVPYIILFAFITAVMLYEFYHMTMGEDFRGLQTAAIAVGTVFFLLVNRFVFGTLSLPVLTASSLLMVVGLMAASVLQKEHTHFLKTAYLYAGLVYVALPLALSNEVVGCTGQYSGLLMLSFFTIIWCSDVGAYCFGMVFGQKIWPAKMCPAISPKKSWAGFLGGLLVAMLAGAVLYWTGLVAFPIWHCLALAAIMNVAGVLGDLFESLWKRAVGIKDSGKIIPGHGGLLDRFDSSLFAFPAGMFYLLITGLI